MVHLGPAEDGHRLPGIIEMMETMHNQRLLGILAPLETQILYVEWLGMPRGWCLGQRDKSPCRLGVG